MLATYRNSVVVVSHLIEKLYAEVCKVFLNNPITCETVFILNEYNSIMHYSNISKYLVFRIIVKEQYIIVIYYYCLCICFCELLYKKEELHFICNVT